MKGVLDGDCSAQQAKEDDVASANAVGDGQAGGVELAQLSDVH
jgi:hypothetical protein